MTVLSPSNFRSSAVPACVSYAVSSTMVTIMNKVVFSHANFNYPWFTLAFQNLISVLVILVARHCRMTTSGKLSNSLSKRMPVPIIGLIVFIFTNAQSLRYVNLPILTVWKSIGPMFVTLFERFYFGDKFNENVYFSMMLIVFSAVVTAINDLEYSPIGYLWAGLNVLANVGYLASLRIYLNDPSLTALDKTFHSNLLSIAPILVMAFASNEFEHVFEALSQRSISFKLAYVFSGVLTTAVCASAFWTIAVTNGSTLSFIGGLNKVPIILFSLVLFDMRVSIASWIGVALSVLAGIVFVRAKKFRIKFDDSSSSVHSARSSEHVTLEKLSDDEDELLKDFRPHQQR